MMNRLGVALVVALLSLILLLPLALIVIDSFSAGGLE